MSLPWQISAGEFFELLRPAAWALSALASTLVLFDAQRRQSKPYSLAAWTLGTLFFPLPVLPVYLIARIYNPRRAKAEELDQPHSQILPGLDEQDEPKTPEEASTRASEAASSAPLKSMPLGKRLLPLVYLIAALSCIALLFLQEQRGVEAHLARANQARLMGQRQRTISEYRAALRLEDDPHTRKLLGIELAENGNWEEALTELRLAEQKGEPDAALPFLIARALDALNRSDEAALAYRSFLHGKLCTEPPADIRCEVARRRTHAASPSPAD